MKEVVLDLSVEELIQSFYFDENKNTYQCIYCKENFEEGLVYFSRGRNVDALRAVQEHIYDKHGSPFIQLLEMGREINGLTDNQKKLLRLIYDKNDNKTIGEELKIQPSTVRTHKYKLQQEKREAKILLALMAYLEEEELIQKEKRFLESRRVEDELVFDTTFNSNLLHPFFGKINLK